MHDEDRATDYEERARESARVTSRKPEGPQPTGFCHYCGERLPVPMRWCGAECRNEWSSMQ